MDSKVKFLLAVLGIIFVGVVIWAVSTKPDAPPKKEKIAPPTVMEYEGNTIVEERNGEKLFELTAGKMVVDVNTQNADFEDFSGKFYQTNDRFVQLTAKKGTYNHQSGDVHVEGDVVATDSDGAKLTCVTLDWDGEEQMLTANGDVKIFKDDMRAYGDVATAANGLRHFHLKGNARVLKGVKD